MTEFEFAQNYLQSVLGVSFVPSFESTRPRFYVLDLPSAGGLANVEMFQKMMSALGLGSRDFSVIECLLSELQAQVAELDPSIPVLSFSAELSGGLRELEAGSHDGAGSHFRVTTLCGPRDLASQPALKRETWTGLQTFVTGL